MNRMINRKTCRAACMALAAGVALAGCSNTGDESIGDLFTGKYVPDEREVRTHQTLAVPPDLQLRPPAPGQGPAAHPNPAAHAPAAAASTHALNTPPEQTVYEAPQAVAANAPAAPAQTAAVTAPAQTPAATEPQDIYQRLGISKTNPDGTEKSERELIEELKKKRIEMEKARNPSYGTIWNIGEMFTSN